MRFLLSAIAALALTATSATAQDLPNDRQTIVVVGEGVAERIPDIFSINVSIQGRGADQVTALRALAGIQTRVSTGLSQLRGLTHSEITTGSLEVEPTFSADCQNDSYRDYEGLGDCEPTGFAASNSLTLTAGPVERAGDALSLASELGARSAVFSGGQLSDRTALQAAARQAAYADAVRQAEALATASGQRIVRPLRIVAENYRPARLAAQTIQEIVVTGSRAPTVAIDVAPPPIRETMQLSVIFEVE